MPHSPVLTVHRDREGAPLRVSASARSCQPTVRGPLLRIKWTEAAPGTRSGVRPAIRRPASKVAVPLQPAAPPAPASRDPRATGARRCLPWWGCGCTTCRSRPSASKNKKRPAAGGGWGGRLPPRMPAGLGGWCPTAPRSKQHARGAGRCRHFRGAHPRRGAFCAARGSAPARPSVHSTRPHVISRARLGRGPVAFPGRPPPSGRASPSSSAAVFLGFDLTGRAWS